MQTFLTAGCNPALVAPKMSSMKVTLRTANRMELRGVPQGRSIPFGVLVCFGIAVAAGFFVSIQWTNSRSVWAVVPPALIVVFMGAMMVVLVLLWMKRERVVLDHVSKVVEHETWSLLWGSRKSRAYPFESIHGVRVQRSLESQGGGKGFPVEVVKARLLISRPRRAIELDEVQSGNRAPVEAIAREVAEFLGVPLEMTGGEDE